MLYASAVLQYDSPRPHCLYTKSDVYIKREHIFHSYQTSSQVFSASQGNSWERLVNRHFMDAQAVQRIFVIWTFEHCASA